MAPHLQETTTVIGRSWLCKQRCHMSVIHIPGRDNT